MKISFKLFDAITAPLSPGGITAHPQPGWIPGPVLRVLIWTCLGVFFLGSLTINYAYSASYFMLAIIGLYIGLRRGFVNGLTSEEKLLMAIFAAFPAAAILTYLCGTQTYTGFRFLGRELRFLLFIPIYLSVRWSFVSKQFISTMAVVGLTGAACYGLFIWLYSPSAILSVGGAAPSGVTGTHITFGDMGLLIGLVAAGILIPMSGALNRTLFFLSIIAGTAVAVFSLARGAWIALPVAAILSALGVPQSERKKYIVFLFAASVCVILIFLWRSSILGTRWQLTLNHVSNTLLNTQKPYDWSTCPNNKRFLESYAKSIFYPIGNPAASIQVEKASRIPANWSTRCKGGFMISVHATSYSQRDTPINLPRIGFSKQRQSFSILVRGTGHFLLWMPTTIVKFESPQFKIISAYSNSRSPGVPAQIIVPPGKTVEFIPLQFPKSYGGYNLVLNASSISDRLHMWRFAWTLFLSHPLAGNGIGSFNKLSAESSIKGNIDAITGREFEHPHSVYLNALYSGGVVLFVCLMLLLICPILVRPKLASLVITIPVAIFGLTESIFVHSFVVSVFVILVSVWAASNKYENEKSQIN